MLLFRIALYPLKFLLIKTIYKNENVTFLVEDVDNLNHWTLNDFQTKKYNSLRFRIDNQHYFFIWRNDMRNERIIITSDKLLREKSEKEIFVVWTLILRPLSLSCEILILISILQGKGIKMFDCSVGLRWFK